MSSTDTKDRRLSPAMRKLWIRGSLLFLLAGLVAAGVTIALNRPIPVVVATLERDVPVRVFGLGTIEARVLSKVGFEVGATLAALEVDHGDRVSEGDVMARLASGEQDAKVAKAEAAVRIAEVNIARGEANVVRARAILEQRREATKRKKALIGRDVVSQQVLEEAERDEAVAQADVTVAESDAASAKAQLTDAKAQLQFETTMLRHRTLLAPYEAIVVERHKELGTVVKPGDPIFTLIAADSYWGLAHVDEARAGFITEGQAVTARIRSRPQDEFTGRVVRIALESDRVTEERKVYVKGDNPPPRIYLGEQVEFWITVARLDEALLVPEAAVRGYDGREGIVWSVEDGRLASRQVKFRHRTDDARLEIVGPLPEGVRVVSQIAAGMREGRNARIREGAGQ